MNWKRHLAEAATLVVAALLCAIVANAIASRERKIALVGDYPNALRVPTRVSDLPASRIDTLANMVGSGTASTTATTAATTLSPATLPAATGTAPTPVASGPHSAATNTAATASKPAKPDSVPVASPAIASTAASAGILARFPPHEKTAYAEIAGDDAANLHKAGVLFLDARRTSVYQQGHIAGARSFPVWESDIDERVTGLFNERGEPQQQAKPIVVYCSGGDCEDSHMLAQKLWGIQFNNVYVYKDGFPDWQKRGGAVHTGANP